MKLFASLVLLFSFFSLPAVASENIVCALKDSKDPQRLISVKVALGKNLEEYYQPKSGLDIGRDNYSFDLAVNWNEQNPKNLDLNVIFYENNHVQDEVASYSWTIDFASAKAGKPIVEEPLSEDDRVLMNFVCYYNR